MAPSDAPSTPGPAISRQILEAQGLFPSDAALQAAISQLELAGYDRADLSLPRVATPAAKATPEQGAENPHVEGDNVSMRTLHASGAGSAAALLGAGLVIGSGGAFAPAIAAALGAGVGGALLAEAGSHISDAAQHESRERAARAGALVLAVRLREESQVQDALEIMRRAGATQAQALRRVDHAVDSANWTG